ncbi:MAG TPA: hypothetical protein VGM54_15930 [Chthoniobacter sp.]|jgi:hypothetical protein
MGETSNIQRPTSNIQLRRAEAELEIGLQSGRYEIGRQKDNRRKAAPKERNGEQAPFGALRQSRGMNYHNFASRLAVSRPAESKPAEVSKKPARKSARRSSLRRPAAVAAAIAVSIGLQAEVNAQPETKAGNPAPRWGVNTATLIVTLTGAAVALLRLPALWQRDFPS